MISLQQLYEQLIEQLKWQGGKQLPQPDIIPIHSQKIKPGTGAAKVEQYVKGGFRGDLYLFGTDMAKLPTQLTKVGGDLIIDFSHIRSLNNVKSIAGSLSLANVPQLFKLEKLEKVDGDLILSHKGKTSRVTTLGNLQHVGGSLVITSTKLVSLGQLNYVGGTLEAMNCPLEDLGSLQYVGEKIRIRATPLADRGLKALQEEYPHLADKFDL